MKKAYASAHRDANGGEKMADLHQRLSIINKLEEMKREVTSNVIGKIFGFTSCRYAWRSAACVLAVGAALLDFRNKTHI